MSKRFTKSKCLARTIKSNMYGPFFFLKPTVTGTVYPGMIEYFLEPLLLTDGILDGSFSEITVSLCRDRTRLFKQKIFNRWIDRSGMRSWTLS